MIDVCILYGGRSGEHEVSCRSAAFVFNTLMADPNYRISAVGITKDGKWIPQKICRKDADGALKPGMTSLPISVATSDRTVGLNDVGPQAMAKLLFGKDSIDPKTHVVFPVLHGTFGEDGTLQGLLDMAEIPYVGSGTLGSALGMDKAISKQLVALNGYKVAKFRQIEVRDWEKNPAAFMQSVNELTMPWFVKPMSLGSSVGMSRVTDKSKVKAAIDEAFRFDTRIIVEEGVKGRELECAVLETKTELLGTHPAEIIVHQGGFYSYEAKYVDDSMAELVSAANVTAKIAERIKADSLAIFRILRLEGLARIDYFYDEDTDELVFSEANTIPGFTAISQYPKMWEAAGKNAKSLIEDLLGTALARHVRVAKLERSFV